MAKDLTYNIKINSNLEGFEENDIKDLLKQISIISGTDVKIGAKVDMVALQKQLVFMKKTIATIIKEVPDVKFVDNENIVPALNTISKQFEEYGKISAKKFTTNFKANIASAATAMSDLHAELDKAKRNEDKQALADYTGLTLYDGNKKANLKLQKEESTDKSFLTQRNTREKVSALDDGSMGTSKGEAQARDEYAKTTESLKTEKKIQLGAAKDAAIEKRKLLDKEENNQKIINQRKLDEEIALINSMTDAEANAAIDNDTLQKKEVASTKKTNKEKAKDTKKTSKEMVEQGKKDTDELKKLFTELSEIKNRDKPKADTSAKKTNKAKIKDTEKTNEEIIQDEQATAKKLAEIQEDLQARRKHAINKLTKENKAAGRNTTKREIAALEGASKEVLDVILGKEKKKKKVRIKVAKETQEEISKIETEGETKIVTPKRVRKTRKFETVVPEEAVDIDAILKANEKTSADKKENIKEESAVKDKTIKKSSSKEQTLDKQTSTKKKQLIKEESIAETQAENKVAAAKAILQDRLKKSETGAKSLQTLETGQEISGKAVASIVDPKQKAKSEKELKEFYSKWKLLEKDLFDTKKKIASAETMEEVKAYVETVTEIKKRATVLSADLVKINDRRRKQITRADIAANKKTTKKPTKTTVLEKPTVVDTKPLDKLATVSKTTIGDVKLIVAEIQKAITAINTIVTSVDKVTKGVAETTKAITGQNAAFKESAAQSSITKETIEAIIKVAKIQAKEEAKKTAKAKEEAEKRKKIAKEEAEEKKRLINEASAQEQKPTMPSKPFKLGEQAQPLKMSEVFNEKDDKVSLDTHNATLKMIEEEAAFKKKLAIEEYNAEVKMIENNSAYEEKLAKERLAKKNLKGKVDLADHDAEMKMTAQEIKHNREVAAARERLNNKIMKADHDAEMKMTAQEITDDKKVADEKIKENLRIKKLDINTAYSEKAKKEVTTDKAYTIDDKANINRYKNEESLWESFEDKKKTTAKQTATEISDYEIALAKKTEKENETILKNRTETTRKHGKLTSDALLVSEIENQKRIVEIKKLTYSKSISEAQSYYVELTKLNRLNTKQQAIKLYPKDSVKQDDFRASLNAKDDETTSKALDIQIEKIKKKNDTTAKSLASSIKAQKDYTALVKIGYQDSEAAAVKYYKELEKLENLQNKKESLSLDNPERAALISDASSHIRIQKERAKTVAAIRKKDAKDSATKNKEELASQKKNIEIEIKFWKKYYNTLSSDDLKHAQDRIKNSRIALAGIESEGKSDIEKSAITSGSTAQYQKEIAEMKKSRKEYQKNSNIKEKETADYYKKVKGLDRNYYKWKKAQIYKDTEIDKNASKEAIYRAKTTRLKMMNELKKDMGAGGTFFKNMMANVRSMLVALGGFYAIKQMIVELTREGLEFESTMASVKAIAQASTGEFVALSQSARELGENTRYTATEVAKLQENFAKIGFSTQEILDASQATIYLATATGEELAEAAEIAGATLKGFGLQAKSTQRIVDVMAASFTSSALNLERFKESMKLVAPMARAVGFSVEQTTAVLSKLADTGLHGSLAGTALRNTFSQIGNSSSKLSKVLGGTANNFEEFIALLKKANDRGEAFKKEALSGLDLRIKGIIISLASQADTLSDVANNYDLAAGAARKMSEIRMDTLYGDLLLLKSAWSELQLSYFDDAGNGFRNIIQSMVSIVKHGKEIITVLTNVAIGFGLYKAIIATRTLAFALNTVKIAFLGTAATATTATTAVAGTTVAVGGLKAGLTALVASNPILLAISLALGVIAGLYYSMSDAEERAKKEMQELNKEAKDTISNIEIETDRRKKLMKQYLDLSYIKNKNEGQIEREKKLLADINDLYIDKISGLDDVKTKYIEIKNELTEIQQLATLMNIKDLGSDINDILMKANTLKKSMSELLSEITKKSKIATDISVRVNYAFSGYDDDAKKNLKKLADGLTADAENAVKLSVGIDEGDTKKVQNTMVVLYKESQKHILDRSKAIINGNKQERLSAEKNIESISKLLEKGTLFLQLEDQRIEKAKKLQKLVLGYEEDSKKEAMTVSSVMQDYIDLQQKKIDNLKAIENVNLNSTEKEAIIEKIEASKKYISELEVAKRLISSMRLDWDDESLNEFRDSSISAIAAITDSDQFEKTRQSLRDLFTFKEEGTIFERVTNKIKTFSDGISEFLANAKKLDAESGTVSLVMEKDKIDFDKESTSFFKKREGESQEEVRAREAKAIDKHMNDLMIKQRDGNKAIDDGDKNKIRLMKSHLDGQIEFYKVEAKVKDLDLKKNKQYQNARYLTIKAGLLASDKVFGWSEDRLEDHIKNMLELENKGNKGRVDNAERLRKALEDIEKRTSVKDDIKEIAQLKKINEYYENKLALLGGTGDLERKSDETAVAYLKRKHEIQKLNEKDIVYAKELLNLERKRTIASLSKNPSQENKNKIKALKKEITKEEAKEHAKLLIVKARVTEQTKIVKDVLEREKKATLKIQKELNRVRGLSVKESIDSEFEERLSKAEKHASDMLALASSNNTNIEKLEATSGKTKAQEIELAGLKDAQIKILNAVTKSSKAVVLINNLKHQKLLDSEDRFNKEYITLRDKIDSFEKGNLENKIDTIEKANAKQRESAKDNWKGSAVALEEYLLMLDKLEKIDKETAINESLRDALSSGDFDFDSTINTIRSHHQSIVDSYREIYKDNPMKLLSLGIRSAVKDTDKATVGILNVFQKAIPNLEKQFKEITSIFKEDPFQGLAKGANIALQTVSGIIDTMANMWNKYYEDQIRQIHEEKDAKLLALEETAAAAEREARFGFEQRQAYDDMEFISNNETRMAEVERIAQQHTAIIQIEDRHAAAKERLEKAALKEEEKLRKKQREWAITQALINGALAITNIWATTPKADFGIMTAVLTAMSIASTAVQIAAIKSQNFAEGGFTSAIGGRDETGERVAGTVHEKEMVFEKKITLPNLKELFILRRMLQKGIKLKDIIAGNVSNLKLPSITLPQMPKLKFASGGYTGNIANENNNIIKKFDELIGIMSELDSTIIENRPILKVVAETTSPIIVSNLTEEGEIDLG